MQADILGLTGKITNFWTKGESFKLAIASPMGADASYKLLH